MFRTCGAGILPYRIGPGGLPVFLLGRECIESGWRGSGKMSAFEGGHEDGESVVDNAVREFTEESLAVLCDDPGGAAKISKEIQDGDFAIRIVIQEVRKHEEHCTFVKQFAWADGIEERFIARRRSLQNIDERGARIRRLVREVPARYPYLYPGDLIFARHQQHVVVSVQADVHHGNTMVVELLLRPLQGWRRPTQGNGASDAALSRESVYRYRFSFGPMSSDCWNYLKLLHLRQEVTRLVNLLPRVLARALRVRTFANGQVREVAVRKEWLEKMSVREVSMPQLLLETHTEPSNFRPFFLMVAHKALAQFVAPSPMHSTTCEWVNMAHHGPR